MDRWKTHRKFIVLLKIIHLTDKPVATCTRVIGICLLIFTVSFINSLKAAITVVAMFSPLIIYYKRRRALSYI